LADQQIKEAWPLSMISMISVKEFWMRFERCPKRLALALACSVAMVACARRSTLTFVLSSVHSTYAPTARLWVALTQDGDRQMVRIDSGVIAVPGLHTANAPVVMRHLFIQAFVAQSDSGIERTSPVSGGRGKRGLWHALIMGDSVPLADSLRYGEQLAVRDLRMVLSRVSERLPRNAWLGFRIMGDAMQIQARFQGSPSDGGRRLLGGVLVFICAEHTILGSLDTARAGILQHAYNDAC
jgi:hypothetical protein